MVYYGILWYIMVYYGILWYIMVYIDDILPIYYQYITNILPIYYQLPITNYQLPITKYQIPNTNYQYINKLGLMAILNNVTNVRVFLIGPP